MPHMSHIQASGVVPTKSLAPEYTNYILVHSKTYKAQVANNISWCILLILSYE